MSWVVQEFVMRRLNRQVSAIELVETLRTVNELY